MNSLANTKEPTPPPVQAARSQESIVKNVLRIRNCLGSPKWRKLESVSPCRPSCSLADGSLVEREPSFLHADRHDADGRRVWLQGGLNFVDSRGARSALCITVYKEEVTRVNLEGTEDALLEALRRVQEPLKVCPLWSKPNGGVIRKKPIQDRKEHPV